MVQEVLERETVHDCPEHADVVGPGTVHASLGQLSTAEVIAAAYDDSNFGTSTHDGCDLSRDRLHDIGIDA
jgi:hypothetical protein